jgi:glycosyltransferase involved in cell wall biosynthesis
VPSLSVVIPVYNEPAETVVTIRSVTAAIREACDVNDAEIVVADDGSTLDVATPARAASDGVPMRVIRLPQNRGRFEARRAGLSAASGDHVLFIDAGVTVVPGSLRFVLDRVRQGSHVWNAHTEMNTQGNPFGLFWVTVLALALGDYLDNPHETSFGLEEFDRFPKGTTCFLAPTELLREAFAAFRSRYHDTRNANDDGPIIRAIARRERIHIAPAFACVYTPRRTFGSFVKHAVHRGIVFLDGHGRRESRLFPVVVMFFPVSVALTASAVKRPFLVPLTAIAVSGAAATAAAVKRRPTLEVASFSALAPVYAVAHGIGMWKGAALAMSARLR